MKRMNAAQVFSTGDAIFQVDWAEPQQHDARCTLSLTTIVNLQQIGCNVRFRRTPQKT
jgi:hypothetical protein